MTTSSPTSASRKTSCFELLTDYTDRFYKALKTGYEGRFYDITHIDEEHGSMPPIGTQFAIENSDDGLEYQAKLELLKEAGGRRARSVRPANGTRHTWWPLASTGTCSTCSASSRMGTKISFLETEAVGPWRAERSDFVRDLEAFYNSREGKQGIGPRSLYLLRNADREERVWASRWRVTSIPDFLLWLVDDASGKWLTLSIRRVCVISTCRTPLGLYKGSEDPGNNAGGQARRAKRRWS